MQTHRESLKADRWLGEISPQCNVSGLGRSYHGLCTPRAVGMKISPQNSPLISQGGDHFSREGFPWGS